MTLKLNEIPTSFTGQALYAGEFNHFLCMSPFDIDQSFGGTAVEAILKGTATLVYNMGVGILCAPMGIVYHTASALYQRGRVWFVVDPNDKQHAKALAWEHVKAAVTDVFGILVAVPTLHFLTYQYIPNARIGWWFSSTPVKTGCSDAEYNSWYNRTEQHKIESATPWVQWGSPGTASAHECPHNIMKITEHGLWKKKRNAPYQDQPPLALAACLRSFKETTASAKWWAAIWPKRLPQSIEQFTPALKEISSRPEYKTPWVTIALAIGAIALLAIGILVLCSPALMRIISASGVSHKLVSAWISGLGVCLGSLAKSYVDNRGEAELTLANQLLKAEAPPQKRRANVQLALFWLIKAGSLGYVPSQRLLGLALLQSLAYCKTVDCMDEYQLAQVKIAISCLQTAAINGDKEAEEDLKFLFKPVFSNLSRLAAGVTGTTDAERVKSMLQASTPPEKNVYKHLSSRLAFLEIAAQKNDAEATQLLKHVSEAEQEMIYQTASCESVPSFMSTSLRAAADALTEERLAKLRELLREKTFLEVVPSKGLSKMYPGQPDLCEEISSNLLDPKRQKMVQEIDEGTLKKLSLDVIPLISEYVE